MKEVVLDTNIFIRYFTQDIKQQYEKRKDKSSTFNTCC